MFFIKKLSENVVKGQKKLQKMNTMVLELREV